jgi:hypothetical protein
MFLDNPEGLYRLSVCFSDGDTLYENCVVYPCGAEIISGEHTLEPFDSLYSRFTAFELKAKREIDTRAHNTWKAIVKFVDSLKENPFTAGSPYEIYIDTVALFKGVIEEVDEDGGAIDYPTLLRKFFIHLEKAEAARRVLRSRSKEYFSA